MKAVIATEKLMAHFETNDIAAKTSYFTYSGNLQYHSMASLSRTCLSQRQLFFLNFSELELREISVFFVKILGFF